MVLNQRGVSAQREVMAAAALARLQPSQKTSGGVTPTRTTQTTQLQKSAKVSVPLQTTQKVNTTQNKPTSTSTQNKPTSTVKPTSTAQTRKVNGFSAKDLAQATRKSLQTVTIENEEAFQE